VLLAATALQAAGVVALPAAAQPAPNARPLGGTITAGTASIGYVGNTTAISQSSARAAIDWQSFNIGSSQKVAFRQPNASAVTLNTVNGPDPSQIAGRIDANGQIIIANRSGVVFSQGAEVNAQSLVVSAAGISRQNFMAGKLVFDQAPQPGARVVNQGSITVKQTGLAAFMAPQVANSGVITAKFGHVVLAGAEAATLDLYGDGLVAIDVSRAVQRVRTTGGQTATALVTNTGAIVADGGTVQLTAAAADGIVTNLIDARGTIRANTLNGHAGTIAIDGTGGSILIAGRVEAEGKTQGSIGGAIELNATQAVTLGSHARVSASGDAGGGVVAVGTTLARAAGGPSATAAMSAKEARIRSGAIVTADATRNGNGGRITLLSTERTDFAGTASARGGAAGGDGGRVEISSGQDLRLTGSANVCAAHGTCGDILVDPASLAIVGAGTSDTLLHPPSSPAPPPNLGFADGGTADATVSATAIEGLTGNVQLQATKDITVATNLTLAAAGQSLALEAGGNITVNPNVAISTPGAITFVAGSGSAPGGGNPAAGIFLDTGSNVSTPTGLLSLTSGTGGISFGGTITVGSVGISTTGPVTQPGGVITAAGALTLAAAANQNLTVSGALSAQNVALSTSGTGTTIVQGPVTTSGTNGTITLTGGSGGIALNAAVGGASTIVDLITTGNVTQTAAGGITASELIGTVSGSATLSTGGSPGPSNNIAAIGTFTVNGAGGFVLDASGTPGTLTVTGPLNAAAGSVTISRPQALAVAGTITASGAISLDDFGGGLTITGTGTVRAPTIFLSSELSGPVSLSAGSSIGQNGGTVTLFGGAITQAPTSVITAGTLQVTLASLVDLPGAANSIANLGSVNTGTFRLIDSAALTVSGPIGINQGNVQLVAIQSASDLTVTTPITVPFFTNQTVSFRAGGTLTVAAGASITASGAVISLSAGDSTIAGFNPAAALTLNSSVVLNSGVVSNPGSIQMSAGSGGIALNAAVGGASAIVDLITTGSVTQTAAGGITASELIGNVSGSVTLGTGGSPGPSNNIAALGTFTVNGAGGFVLDASGTPGTLTVTGPLNAAAGPVTISRPQALAVAGTITANGAISLDDFGGGLTITGTVRGPTIFLSSEISGPVSLSGGSSIGQNGATVTLFGGAITQDPTSVITAGTLQAPLASLVDLPGTANSIANLGSVNTFGTLRLIDSAALTISGPIGLQANVQLVAIQSAGDLTVTTPITVPFFTNQTVSFLAGGNLTVAAGASITAGGGGVISLSAGGSGGIALNAPIGAGPSGTVDLITSGGGNVTQTAAGGITASELIGTVSGSATLSTGGSPGPSNNIAAIGPFTISGGGGFVLDASGTPGTLTVTGPLNAAAGSVTISRPQALAVAGTITANGAISLDDFGGGLTITGTGAVRGPTIFLSSEISGPVSLSAGSSIGQNGAIVTLLGGDITQDPTSVITAGTLLVSLANFVDLAGAANSIATLESVSTFGTFRLIDSAALTVSGPINIFSPGNVVIQSATDLTVTTPITVPFMLNQTVSFHAGGNLTVAAGAPITAGGVVSLSAGDPAIAGFNPAAALTLNSAVVSNPGSIQISAGSGGIALNAAVSGSAGVDLTTTGGVVQQTAADIVTTAGALTGNAVGTVDLSTAPNVIGTLGSFTSKTGFALNVAGSLAIAGNISAPTVLLTATGAITEPSGAIIADTLSGGAASVALTGPNSVATVTGLSASGPFAFNDTRSLVVGIEPVFNNSGDLSISTSGDLTINAGLIESLGTVALTVGGAMTEINGGSIFAHVLTGSAASVTLDQPGNSVATLGSFATQAGFNLVNGAFTSVPGVSLTVAGPVTDGTRIAITSNGPLTVAGNIVAPTVSLTALPVVLMTGPGDPSTGTLTQSSGQVAGRVEVSLSATGTIDQTGGTIVAGLLVLNSGGPATLTSAGNAVASLGDLSTRGNFALTTSSDLALTGALTAPNVSLVASGTISQPAGAITTTGTLSGVAASANFSSVANSVAALGSFASGADFLLADVGALAITGTVAAGTARTLAIAADAPAFVTGGLLEAPAGTVVLKPLNAGTPIALGGGSGIGGSPPVIAHQLIVGAVDAGPITIAGALNLAQVDVLNLVSAGAISESGSGAIAVPVLTGHGASATLSGANAIGTLGSFTTTGGFSLANGADLSVTGLVSDGVSVSLNASGNLAIAGSISAPTVALRATGAITEPGGAIIANALSGSAASVTLTGPNAVANITRFLASGPTGPGPFDFNDTRSLVVSGTVLGDLSISTPGDLTISGELIESGGSVVLTVGGAIIEVSGGFISADVLTGSAGSAALNQPNAVITLGPFTTGAGFALNDAAGLAVKGPVTDRVQASLTVAGDLVLEGDVSAPAVALTASGAISQPAGAIAADSLTGRAASAAFPGANVIATLGNFATSGGFVFADTVGLTLKGTLSAGNAVIAAPGITLADDSLVLGPAGAHLTVLPETNGRGTFRQTGTTVVTGTHGGGTSLNITLPQAGGIIAFGSLAAPGTALVLTTGAGIASGFIDTGSLLVVGNTGGSNLFGFVAGVRGPAAAAIARIQPQIDPHYLLNGCVIELAVCFSSLTAFPNPDLFAWQSQNGLAWQVQNDMPQTSAAAAAAMLTLPRTQVVRQPRSPDIELPNISNLDY
jgi:filamentous hemagglutinin family protein